MHKFVMPDGPFTLKECVEANPDAAAQEVRLWFAYQVRDRVVEIVDGARGVFKRSSVGRR
jgi:hypothetical protein